MASIKARLAEVRAIVNRQTLGMPLTGENDTFFRKLIKAHSEYPVKFEPGVRHFYVQQNPHYPNRTCYAMLTDGRTVSFSWVDCVCPKKMNHRDYVVQAFRWAIKGQVVALGEKGKDVHHAKHSFDTLFESFLFHRNLSLADVKVTEDVHGKCELASAALKADWQEFHRAYAYLEVMDRKEHQKLPRRAA